MKPARPTETTEATAAAEADAATGHYQPGETLDDKYLLVRKMGRGGMGSVWIAHNNVLDVHCALKLIEVEDRRLTERLLREARAAAKLGHPAIVRVLDYGKSARGDSFIAMELLDGEDLGALLNRQGKLPAIDAVRLMLPIAHALGTAHSKEIVHRDLKPENVFLSKNEVAVLQPKLLDFGLARILDDPSRLTIEGTVLGSTDYMAPEQALGKPVTALVDVWSFCVVLYEVLAGQRPFPGDNDNDILHGILEQEPPSLADLGVADADLSAIVERGLNKNPDDRWPTMRDLGEHLALWLDSRGVKDDITGTALHHAWLAETDSKKIPIPPSATARRPVPAGAPSPARVAVPAAPGPTVAARAVPAPVVDADADDPFVHASRNRRVGYALALVVAVIALVLALLIGTGIVSLG